MYGLAVCERCPRCRMVLDTLAVTAGATVIHKRKCTTRRCRQEPPIFFFIRDQKVEVLTRERAEAMLATT